MMLSSIALLCFECLTHSTINTVSPFPFHHFNSVNTHKKNMHEEVRKKVEFESNYESCNLCWTPFHFHIQTDTYNNSFMRNGERNNHYFCFSVNQLSFDGQFIILMLLKFGAFLMQNTNNRCVYYHFKWIIIVIWLDVYLSQLWTHIFKFWIVIWGKENILPPPLAFLPQETGNTIPLQ